MGDTMSMSDQLGWLPSTQILFLFTPIWQQHSRWHILLDSVNIQLYKISLDKRMWLEQKHIAKVFSSAQMQG